MRKALSILLPALLLWGCPADWKSRPEADISPTDVPPEDQVVEDSVTPLDGRHEDRVDETTPDLVRTDPQPFIDEGRYWLSNGEPAFARQAFEAALEIAPDSTDARFGAGLAEYVRAVELMGMVLTLPAQFGAYGAGEGTSPAIPDPESENDYMVQSIHEILLYLREGFAAAEGHFALLEDPDFEWAIEAVPIFIFTRPVVNLHGTFDRGDLYLLRSSNAFFLWFTELLAAQDFHSDLLTAVYGALAARDEGIDVLAVLNIVATLLASDERFFTLYEADGEFLFDEGARHMREAGEFLLAGLAEQVQDESGDHAITVRFENGDTILVVRNRVDFHEQVEEEMTVRFSPELQEACADLLVAMEEPGTVRSFAQGPAVQLAVLLGFATKLDILQFMPVEIPLDLSNMEPDQVGALLTVLLGNSLGFDYGTLLNNPVGLRRMFPLLVKVPKPTGPEDFYMEWECPAETEGNGLPKGSGDFLCTDAAELVDAPHFLGTEHEIDADGLPSRLPYMVWDDPTWGGFLLVDEWYQDNGGDPASFLVPDLFWTNVGVRQWVDPILGLL